MYLIFLRAWAGVWPDGGSDAPQMQARPSYAEWVQDVALAGGIEVGGIKWCIMQSEQLLQKDTLYGSYTR